MLIHSVIAMSIAAAPEPGADVREFLGPDALAVLTSFHKMEILVLEPPLPGEHDARAGHETVRVKGTRTVAEPYAQELAAIFLRDRTYRFDRSKTCTFIPKSGLRLTDGFHRLDLLLSFECKTFRMVLYDDQGKVMLRKEEDFDRSKRKLRRLMKKALRNELEREVVASTE
jgi:hypothetical protein